MANSIPLLPDMRAKSDFFLQARSIQVTMQFYQKFKNNIQHTSEAILFVIQECSLPPPDNVNSPLLRGWVRRSDQRGRSILSDGTHLRSPQTRRGLARRQLVRPSPLLRQNLLRRRRPFRLLHRWRQRSARQR